MKALLFTLDAIFSLTIAAVSVSVLIYFTYLAQTPYPLHYSDIQAVFSNLASTRLDLAQNTSLLAKAMFTQFSGANQTSPQFLGGVQRNSSGATGPLEPILAYTFNPRNAITTGVVADYGNFYFAANTLLYAVNATTNATVWTKNTITAVLATPALYSGMIYYANTTILASLNAKTGTVAWSVNDFSAVNSPITAYENEVITENNLGINAYAAYNGTLLWSAPTPAGIPQSLTMAGGNLAVKTSSNFLETVIQTPIAANLLFGAIFSLPNFPTNNFAASGSTIYMGVGSSANAISPNGMVASGFPLSTASGITGVAVYRNYIIYQNLNSVLALSPSGTQPWGGAITVPASYGTALSNSTPVVTGTTVYTLWTNGLAAENLTTGAFKWFSLIPNVRISPYMTLAYGRLYVVANNRVLAYGPCTVPTHASLLSASATLYLNKQPGCASALLNSVYPMNNYTVYTVNSAARTVSAASFTGGGNILAENSAQIDTPLVTVSFWINTTAALPASGVVPVSYGSNAIGSATGWFFYLLNNGIQFNIGNVNPYTAYGPVLKTNNWYNIVGTYNGSALSLFVNGAGPYSSPDTGTIAPAAAGINLAIGGAQTGTYLTGNMANLQIYNKPLSVQQVSQLYIRGVQGVPVQGAGLVAWYPLAGDANDYAMFNTGYAKGISFVYKNYISSAFAGAFDIVESSTALPLLNFTSGVTNTIQVGVYSWS